MESDTRELLERIEKENDGPLAWRTYAFFLSSSEGKTRVLGGLLYIVGDKLIFEDFPSERSTYFLLFRRRGEYSKFKIVSDLGSVRKIVLTTQHRAADTLRRKGIPGQIEECSQWQKLWRKTIHMILFDDGSAWFCELFDSQGLKTYIEENT